jgi:hypothetical protein
MPDEKYLNNSAEFTKNAQFGEELQVFETDLELAGAEARALSFSSKSSGEEAKEEVATNKEVEKEVTKTLTGSGTTAVTSTVAAGVVIGAAVIFTSVLGNHFKIADNSLSITTYRDIETNTINLDYSFDLLYDRSGSVYVKLLSAAQSKTSEEILLYYEEPEEEYVEPVDGEPTDAEPGKEDEPVTKDKEVYTINIEGTFDNLIEKNQYNFVVTEVIDGTESQLYSSRVYIPAYYVNVIEHSVEVYKNQQNEYEIFYGFFLNYEVETDVYVELKRIDEEGKYVLEQTSEKKRLEIRNIQDEPAYEEGNFDEYAGTFTNLIEDAEYVISLISDANGIVNTAYTERVYAHIDREPVSYTITDENVSTEIFLDNNSKISLAIMVHLDEYKGGSLQFELINLDSGEKTLSELYEVNNYGADGTADGSGVEAYMIIDDLSTNYVLNIYSVIDIDNVLAYTKEIDTNIEFGSITGDAILNSLNGGGYMTYTLEFEAYSQIPGQFHYEITDPDNPSFKITSRKFDFRYNDSQQIQDVVEGLTGNRGYDIEFFGNWGHDDVSIYTGSIYALEYGITVNPDAIIKNYEEEFIRVPITLLDPESFLTNIEGTLTFYDEENQVIQEFNQSFKEGDEYIGFSLGDSGIIKGSYAVLSITANDINSGSDEATEFVRLAVWY